MENSHNRTEKNHPIENGHKKENNRKLGGQKEQQAKQYLESKGYHIMEENFYAKGGEIDLIGKEDGYLVFIEVKYRSSSAAGHPLEAVTVSKQNTIIRTARYYMYKHHLPEDTPCRFDVVAILGEEITLIKDAF